MSEGDGLLLGLALELFYSKLIKVFQHSLRIGGAKFVSLPIERLSRHSGMGNRTGSCT